MAWFLLVAGLVVLVLGAELLVRGASSLALAWGVTPLVVGLTVVAFGTSAPEVAVSVRSSLAGQADLAIGNAIGSNLFNVLFILGLSSLVAPLVVGSELVRRDIPVMIAVSLAVWALSIGGWISPPAAGVLLVAMLCYTGWLVWMARKTGADAPGEEVSNRLAFPWAALFILVGLALLVLGAGWLVDGAVAIARRLGVSELVIGLTIVAAGTSFPELATSVVAAARGQRDIAIGNIVGSNIFNLLGVLGAAGVVSGGGLQIAPTTRAFDLPFMVGICLLCWPLCRSGFVLTRAEGGVLIAGYALYTLALACPAIGQPLWGEAFRWAAWAWLGIGLVGGSALAWRSHRTLV